MGRDYAAIDFDGSLVYLSEREKLKFSAEVAFDLRPMNYF